MTGPVVKLEAIAEACRPMAVCLLAPSLGREPTLPETNTAALKRLADARGAPGRIGWAVRLILEGVATGTHWDEAADIVLRVAGYDPRVSAEPTQPPAPRQPSGPPNPQRRHRPFRAPASNQPNLPGLER